MVRAGVGVFVGIAVDVAATVFTAVAVTVSNSLQRKLLLFAFVSEFSIRIALAPAGTAAVLTVNVAGLVDPAGMVYTALESSTATNGPSAVRWYVRKTVIGAVEGDGVNSNVPVTVAPGTDAELQL